MKFICSSLFIRMVNKLQPFSLLRKIAKVFFKFFFNDWIIIQPFYSGVICCHSIEHSWAWTGKIRYESFDRNLQDKLLSLSYDFDLFIDVGANIGAMTLSVTLRNPHIRAISVEPGEMAVRCLKESILRNKLGGRVGVLQAAVSNVEDEVFYNGRGSVTGFISKTGEAGSKRVSAVPFPRLINTYASGQRCLIKMDIEGYETLLLRHLCELGNLSNLCFVVEIHPFGCNDYGNPQQCIRYLRDSNATIESLEGGPIQEIPQDQITQIIANWR